MKEWVFQPRCSYVQRRSFSPGEENKIVSAAVKYPSFYSLVDTGRASYIYCTSTNFATKWYRWFMDAITLKVGDEVYGFRVKSVQTLSEYDAVSVRLLHIDTMMDVLHIIADDPENLFAFIFRTPPKDDTGVAHIVEHAVLAGSQRFPVKEPFVHLLKGSMNTFLNAFTFPDKTAYPASSLVEKDFYNLMSVYGDAVFHPLMRKETFFQEAYHYEFVDPGDTKKGLRLVGVVYNEMKGAYADHDSIVGRISYQSLFPNTVYGLDSGGDPTSIPDLAYENFLDFQRQYYHPSNCRMFLYGNIPTEKHLRFLQNQYLHTFSQANVQSEIEEQMRWNAPKTVKKSFPIQKEDQIEHKTSVVLNWLTVSISEHLQVHTLQILSEILIGNAGSPLRKALVESGLGEDISPASGLETELKEVVFSIGLRGTEVDHVGAIEELVLRTLTKLRKDGIDEKTLQAAIHKVEFRNREITGGGAPYGLRVMRRAIRGWLHGLAPEDTLRTVNWMDQLKEICSNDSKYLPNCIQKFFPKSPQNHSSRISRS